MTANDLRIAISGAGLSGLCLAQGLAQAGIEFDLYEREVTFGELGEGYRIRINADGQAALKACLSKNAYLLVQQCSSLTDPSGRFYDTQFNPIGSNPANTWNNADIPQALKEQIPDIAINRHVLRQILLNGLEERVQFKREVIGFECSSDKVTVSLSNGEASLADVLVGADGAVSAVRRRLAPSITNLDTNDIILYGKSPLKPDFRSSIDPILLKDLSIIRADGYLALIDPMIFRKNLADRIQHFAPNSKIQTPDDYLYFCLIGKRRALKLLNADVLFTADNALANALSESVALWHPSLRYAFAHVDSGSLSLRSIFSSVGPPEWPTSRVTLIGDAAHVMNIFGGLGANTALVDAVELTQWLIYATKGQMPLQDAISAYEADMRARAGRAIDSSSFASLEVT